MKPEFVPWLWIKYVDYVLYNPISKELITSHNEPPVHPWIRSMLHTLHQLHTRLDLGKIGIYIVTFLSFLCSLTIISGIFLYGPFRKSYSKASVLSKKMKIGALHCEFSIVATVWGFILCIKDVKFLGIALNRQNADQDDLKIREVKRKLTEEEVKKLADLDKKADEAYFKCKKIVKRLLPEMNLVIGEYTFDEGKLIFYFTANNRLDFRELVKEVNKTFKKRVEFYQIKTNDEGRILSAFGKYGREIYW